MRVCVCVCVCVCVRSLLPWARGLGADGPTLTSLVKHSLSHTVFGANKSDIALVVLHIVQEGYPACLLTTVRHTHTHTHSHTHVPATVPCMHAFLGSWLLLGAVHVMTDLCVCVCVCVCVQVFHKTRLSVSWCKCCPGGWTYSADSGLCKGEWTLLHLIVSVAKPPACVPMLKVSSCLTFVCGHRRGTGTHTHTHTQTNSFRYAARAHACNSVHACNPRIGTRPSPSVLVSMGMKSVCVCVCVYLCAQEVLNIVDSIPLRDAPLSEIRMQMFGRVLMCTQPADNKAPLSM